MLPHKEGIQYKNLKPTSFVVGMDTDGIPMVGELAKYVHMLVTGTTGSGKSAAVNAWLTSICVHNDPSDISITWIDPKFVEAQPYAGMVFCPIPVVDTMSDAYGMLKFLTCEMDERLKKQAKVKAHNITEYNEWWESHQEEAKKMHFEKMKYLIVIIDEYNDMKMQVPEVEDEIIRIAQKARAAGIHMIIATQKATADVISTTVRDNLPTRVCFLQKSNSAASIMFGSEYQGMSPTALQGYGDGIIQYTGCSNGKRIQTLFIDTQVDKKKGELEPELTRIFNAFNERFKDSREHIIDYKSYVVQKEFCTWHKLTDEELEKLEAREDIKNFDITKHDRRTRPEGTFQTEYWWNDGYGDKFSADGFLIDNKDVDRYPIGTPWSDVHIDKAGRSRMSRFV